MSIAMRYRLDRKYKALLTTTTLTNGLIGDSTSPRTVSLTHDSKISLTLASDLALLILLDGIRQLSIVLRLLAVVDTREGGTRKRRLREMRYNDVKALGQRVRNKTVLTLFDRAEYLASNRFLKLFRRICVNGLLDDKSDVLRAAWWSAPARGLKRGHFGVVGVINTKKAYTKLTAMRSGKSNTVKDE